MQLVASVFLWIAPALFLTYFMNQNWFWEYLPDGLRQYATEMPWTSFVVGLLALMAAWFGGERFILRQVRELAKVVRQIASGDLKARTGLKDTEIGRASCRERV